MIQLPTIPPAAPPVRPSDGTGQPAGWPVPTLEADGFAATVDAYAWELDADTPTPRMRLWFLSMLGAQQAVKALWARLIRGDVATMRLPDPEQPTLIRARFCALAAEGPRRWHLLPASLPASAGYQGVLVPDAARYANPRADFLLLPRTADEAAALHHRFLSQRLDLPLHSAWAEWLWARALRTNEAVALEARGLFAYRCIPDASALAIELSAAVAGGVLGVPDESASSERCADVPPEQVARRKEGVTDGSS